VPVGASVTVPPGGTVAVIVATGLDGRADGAGELEGDRDGDRDGDGYGEAGCVRDCCGV
jgi:hypothetical protein